MGYLLARVLLAQTPSSLDGTIDLIQLGFVGIALLWFAMGRVHPDNTVKDLKEQLTIRDKIIADERADSKSVRDAIIKDVAPVMARLADRDKEIVELLTRILAQGRPT
jgi:hypothetical protein